MTILNANVKAPIKHNAMHVEPLHEADTHDAITIPTAINAKPENVARGQVIAKQRFEKQPLVIR